MGTSMLPECMIKETGATDVCKMVFPSSKSIPSFLELPGFGSRFIFRLPQAYSWIIAHRSCAVSPDPEPQTEPKPQALKSRSAFAGVTPHRRSAKATRGS